MRLLRISFENGIENGIENGVEDGIENGIEDGIEKEGKQESGAGIYIVPMSLTAKQDVYRCHDCIAVR